ncbi:MAG: hypothetical protein R3C55_17640 [Parvularculaceae bacterium]
MTRVESVFLLNIKHDFENFSVKINGGYGNSKVRTSMDYDGGVGPALTVPAALAALPGVLFPHADGTFPISAFDVGITGSNGLVGTIGGHEQSRSNRYQSVDMSIGESDYWSAEGIIATDFDSAFNFMVGANQPHRNERLRRLYRSDRRALTISRWSAARSSR